MSSCEQLLALRGSKGIKICKSPPLNGEDVSFPKVENPTCRDMSFTLDGKLMSWCTSQGTSVVESSNYQALFKVDDPRVSLIHFSSKGNYLSTWTPYSAKQNQQESCNLHIWDIASGKCIKSFIQKKQIGWNPQWSDDEFLCARNVNNEVHFFEKANFDTISKKIFLQKVAYFSLAPGNPPYHLACFVPGVKGQPSFVRLFKYPDFEGPNSIIAQKSFFKAERTDFYWNKTGKDCIFLTSVDVDKSGASYYGELNLYYASVKGDTAKLTLGKDGPVYSVKWNPSSTEFCVVYGYMPAKATIYNLKCEPVFDFGAGPRNEVAYSPLGDRLSLSGFGNLNGWIEVWDLKMKKQISKFQAQDSTLIEWSYDGEFILTATTSPRLRIGNGYRVWHYTSSLQQEIFLDANDELYDIRWVPVPEGKFKAKPTKLTPVPGIQSASPQISKEVYRPPGAQGKQASFKLHDEEDSKTSTNDPSGGMSKNKKKNLARKAKKENEKSVTNDERLDVSDKNESTNAIQFTGDPEKDKKIKSLMKKLEQIEKLKKDQAAGKKLELNQLEKIKKVGELEDELEKLRLG
ncbi:eukaryotic translation initiation factor 2A [Parasteatoda tepidariorum]|uniref:eukaryotic translation initiation factor 2A n=1 Tax=Parasteatoda tepidariorum TaxID=114398 RepID=UPI001C722B3F|nr:eukaryotic translation initiation factor 2A isoform X1 [Parasteatoda tepidariorum]